MADSVDLADEMPIDTHDIDDGEASASQADVPAAQRRSGSRSAVIFALIAVFVVAGLAGWLGFRAYESRQAQAQRSLFLQVGRQSALNLTTISYTEAEADVQRILDSATAPFHDDFQKRSQPFIEVVKKAQSKSVGTITEAGLQSADGDHGEVLVAVSVKTATAGDPEPQPRAWRMRISVLKVNDGAKVSNVEFVP
jgi:Mce-associated membrane protein